MKKIIVAIGGEENGRPLENGKFASYDTELIDKEIVELSNKSNPNFLFLGHAMAPNYKIEKGYFETMKKIYGKMLNCNCDVLYSNELENRELVDTKIKWADIIYEGGGDTSSMIKLWKKTNFDKKLVQAWNDGKIICGVSAGAVCWFKSSNFDSPDKEKEFKSVNCLNWFDLHMTPHSNENGRKESSLIQLKENNLFGLMLYNSCAIEIIDNNFKIIKDNSNAFAIKAY